MKNLASSNPVAEPVTAAAFSSEFSMQQMRIRHIALSARLKELEQQIESARRTGDTDEARELTEFWHVVNDQRKAVQTIITTPRRMQRDELYHEFYSKHGKESPERVG